MLVFVENQIKLAEMINSPQEMQHWYLMLGFQLAKHGPESKIRQVLDQLLGSSFRLEDTPKSTILGISKYTLCEAILDQLKTQPKWQRIYMEYSEQIKFRRGEQQEDAEMTAAQE